MVCSWHISHLHVLINIFKRSFHGNAANMSISYDLKKPDQWNFVKNKTSIKLQESVRRWGRSNGIKIQLATLDGGLILYTERWWKYLTIERETSVLETKYWLSLRYWDLLMLTLLMQQEHFDNDSLSHFKHNFGWNGIMFLYQELCTFYHVKFICLFNFMWFTYTSQSLTGGNLNWI